MSTTLVQPFFKKTPIRWGVIGCGSVTEKKSVPAYQMVPEFKVTQVMRRNADLAADYAKRHKVPKWTTNAAELITDPEIDAIYIATPPDTHKYYALEVAKAGKPCCIEKPMAPSYLESLEIYTAFSKRDVPLFVAYYRRSLPRFLKVKEWLDAELIGSVRQIHWQKSKAPNETDLKKTQNWRTDKKVALGGYFDDLASHGLDLFTFLLGPIKAAAGLHTNQQNLYSSFDAVSGIWEHSNGVLGSGNWNFGTAQRIDEVRISGEKGEIRFSVLDEAPLILRTEEGEQLVEIANPIHIQQYHAQNLKQHLVDALVHPSTGQTGLHTAWVMDKILGRIS